MNGEVLSTCTFSRCNIVNPFAYGWYSCRYLTLTAYGHRNLPQQGQDPVRTPTPSRDTKLSDIRACITVRNMELVPTSSGGTTEVPYVDSLPRSSSFAFNMPKHDQLKFADQVVFNMLAILNCCPDSFQRVMEHMPRFLVNAADEAGLGGFASVVVAVDVVQIDQSAVMDAGFLLEAAMHMEIVEVVKAGMDGICVVCQDKLCEENKEVSKLALCSHEFHSECIGKFFRYALMGEGLERCRCPICRSEI